MLSYFLSKLKSYIKRNRLTLINLAYEHCTFIEINMVIKFISLFNVLFFSQVFCIPQRVIMSIMCFLAIAIAYAMRVCLSVAITEMVVKKNQTESIKGHSICPADPSTPGNVTISVRATSNLTSIQKFH